MFSVVSRAQEAETTQADQGLALATSLTRELDLFLLTMTVCLVLPVTSASAWESWAPTHPSGLTPAHWGASSTFSVLWLVNCMS